MTNFENDSHFKCEILADSYNDHTGSRLTTFQLTFPRMILSEMNTHRKFSRNYSSSRAIPNSRLRSQVWNDCYVPLVINTNKSGMQGGSVIGGTTKKLFNFMWRASSKVACCVHYVMDKWLHVHKQITNRILEPYLTVTGVITSSEWNNFLELRCSEFAQPEIQKIAGMIKIALASHKPKHVDNELVHLPYIDEDEYKKFELSELIKLSVARTCRVSYNNMLISKSNYEKDIALFDHLIKNKHFSAFEHVGIPCQNLKTYIDDRNDKSGKFEKPIIRGIQGTTHKNMQRNFDGWYQLRAMVDNPHNNEVWNSEILRGLKKDIDLFKNK